MLQHVVRGDIMRRTLANLAAAVTAACVCALGAAPAAAQEVAKPRVLVIFDTSGSMLRLPSLDAGQCARDGQTDLALNVFGDGSEEFPGADIDCDGDPDGDRSRLFVMKDAFRDIIFGVSELEFGLMRYYQDELEDAWEDRPGLTAEEFRASCVWSGASRTEAACGMPALTTYDPNACVPLSPENEPPGDDWSTSSYLCTNRSGQLTWYDVPPIRQGEGALNYDGFGRPRDTGNSVSCENGGQMLVCFDEAGNPDPACGKDRADLESTPEILTWIDNREDYPMNKELRGDGNTPIAGSLIDSLSYLQRVIQRDPDRDCRSYSIIVMTDGIEACGGDPVAAAGQAWNGVVVDGQRERIPVYVVAFGSDLQNAVDLDAMASAGSGGAVQTPFKATTRAQLATALSDIIQRVIRSETECDGEDDDCDGLVDENIVRQCQTACGTGSEVCEDGVFSDCDAPVPVAEGEDGRLLTRDCGNDCGPGTQECTGQGWGVCSAPPAEDELCNNRDDDCDGTVDEELQRACYAGPAGTEDTGQCIAGLQTCEAGDWGGCEGEVTPDNEVCDGEDDDCDGTPDENLLRSCYSGPEGTADVGACRSGREACAAGDWGECQGERGPEDEACDGSDNDCDGTTDEGFGLLTCGMGACTREVSACVVGLPQECRPGDPIAEILCDGEDNDCDGSSDEGERACYTGPEGTEGVGTCRAGAQTCCGGDGNECPPGGALFGRCEGQVLPVAEVCDGLDNDCDGRGDEGVFGACYTGPEGTEDVGACRGGQRLCDGGQPGDCFAEIIPVDEVCNGVDDDCDGSVDEELTRVCRGACGDGVARCEYDADFPDEPDRWWVGCTAEDPQPEACNGLDDDCDGATDEGFGELGQACDGGVGACARQGIVVCAPNGEGTTCSATPGDPRAEVCNGIDDDCDGSSDETLVRACESVCGAGEETCEYQAGEPGAGVNWAGCDAPQPRGEECNGQDDDCDGETDENLVRLCSTACGTGVETCQYAGEGDQTNDWAGCDAPVPADEVCGVADEAGTGDEDCDGRVDEYTEVCQAACGSGVRRCVGGELGPCPVREPADEDCDGADDDCDGRIDEGVCGDERPCVNGECPGGFRCVEDFCVRDLCQGVRCSGGQVCDEGDCVDGACVGVRCGAGSVCREGMCEAVDCYEAGCPNGQVCSAGACVA
ncbi:MAG: vWA domain-containing protein, partial [Planctomycetota bacterium]